MFAERAPLGNGDATLVLLHGLGSDEQDLIALAPELDPRLRIRSYRAPLNMADGGYAWFPIEFRPDGSRHIDQVGAQGSLEALIAEIENLQAECLILGGFSQGGMMAAAVLLARPDLVSAVWVMSGMLLPGLDRSETLARPVLVQHGEFDPVIPIQAGRALAETLKTQGHAAEFKAYPMAHQVSLESIGAARAWIAGL